MIKNLLTAVLLFVFLSGQAQMNEYFDDIKKTFDKDLQKDLAKIKKGILSGEKLEGAAQQASVSGNFKKAVSKSKKISGIYEKNYRNLFLMYETKLDKLSKEMQGDMQTYIADLLRKAKKSYSDAIADRHLANKEKDNKIAYELYESAHKNEVDAINNQSRSFGVINGWIKDDISIPEEENFSLENNFDNSATENFTVKKFSDKEASNPENYSFNKEKQIEQNLFSEEELVVNSDGNENTVHTGKVNDGNNEVVVNTNYSDDYSNTNSTSDYSNNNSSNQNNYASSGAEYRIQIGTSILPANESQISRLNSTDLTVNTYKSNVYYKYTIGNFATFEEAKNYKNAYGLSKTYITKYENGREVKFYMSDSQ